MSLDRNHVPVPGSVFEDRFIEPLNKKRMDASSGMQAWPSCSVIHKVKFFFFDRRLKDAKQKPLQKATKSFLVPSSGQACISRFVIDQSEDDTHFHILCHEGWMHK